MTGGFGDKQRKIIGKGWRDMDMDDDILCYRKKEISELKDVMYNVQIILFR